MCLAPTERDLKNLDNYRFWGKTNTATYRVKFDEMALLMHPKLCNSSTFRDKKTMSFFAGVHLLTGLQPLFQNSRGTRTDERTQPNNTKVSKI